MRPGPGGSAVPRGTGEVPQSVAGGVCYDAPMKSEPSLASLSRVVAWYFARVYGIAEGPGVLPFYCDPSRIGRFAVEPAALAAGNDAALFKVFVGMSMYQARRDVVIMRQQKAMSAASVAMLAAPRRLQQIVSKTDCHHLASAAAFDAGCDVRKAHGVVDSGTHRGVACPVKDATTDLRRMGDSGKVAVSAWLHHWRAGGLRAVLAEVRDAEQDPAVRADLLVDRFAQVHRVGRKLATMFVAAVTAPALAPGLTPWFPAVDGHALVVVDTHVARAIDTLRSAREPRSYEARARWLKGQAARLDLREFHPNVPAYAPRIVQQALYAFGSKSNRTSAGDECAGRAAPCTNCVRALCPFA